MENKIKPDLLDWTEGKVKGFKGKELLNHENGSVKLVSVSPQSEYPIHFHPDKTEYIYVLEGKIICMVGAEEISVPAGEFLIFPENMKHNISNPSTTHALLLVGAINTD